MNKVYEFELPEISLFKYKENEVNEALDVYNDYDKNKDYWDDYDYCYECTGYGDDYYLDEDGELQSA